MNIELGQVAAVGALTLFAAVCAALLYALYLMGGRLVRWLSGTSEAAHAMRTVPHKVGPFDPTLTAADLVAIRSNLLAVTRQIEDLERRIRLSAIAQQKPSTTPHAPLQGKPISA